MEQKIRCEVNKDNCDRSQNSSFAQQALSIPMSEMLTFGKCEIFQ